MNELNKNTQMDRIKECVEALYECTMQLAAVEDKTYEQIDMIRKNCETLLACYTSMWL